MNNKGNSNQMDVEPQQESQRTVSAKGQRRLFLINRALIVLAVAAILAGLLFDQWHIVLRNAILL